MRLIDKNILVTGGTSGIGLKLVEKLYQNNNIYILARDKNKIKALKERFPTVTAYHIDLNDIGGLKGVVATLNKDINKLDLLINNAAVQYTPTLLDSDFEYESISHEVNTNFTSICCLCYLLLPMLNRQHDAIILNVNSGLALVPKTTSAIYCATKGALNTFSQSLRHQLRDTQVKVLQAFLPLVDTPMTEGRGRGKLTIDKVSSEIIKGIEKNVLDNDIGKVKFLRILNRLLPGVAKEMMRRN
jgi:short-subunit dehydrogenase involved in D-alanine esterification of teichoic acids